jgi:hypothetical protein
MPRRGQGSVDGAWWPYSRNLEVELADLIDHFPADAGHVRRVLFSRPDWQSFPRRVAIGRGFIKTGSFPADDTHLLVLKLSTGAQLNVLVIPPETPPEAARAILLRAATASDKSSPSSLLATVTAPDAGERGITGGTASDEHPAHENEPAHPNMAYVSTDEDADYSQDEGGEG